MAQLGARLNGIQKVSGSIPLGSTKEKGSSPRGLSFLLLIILIMSVYDASFAPPQGFQRIRLQLSWDGKPYCGWQIQHNAASIQQELQQAIRCLGVSDPFLPMAAGRTDTGVHAEQMTAHWDLPLELALPPVQLARALNAHLPPQISVLESSAAPPTFHARFSCIERRYVYRLWVHPQRHALWNERALHIHHALDLSAMNAAALQLIGTHNFAAFATKEDRHTIRELRHLEVVQQDSSLWEIHVWGESFLRHMVRGLVGTLLLVGRGRLPVEQVSSILQSEERAKAGANVAASGLYFASARYPERFNL